MNKINWTDDLNAELVRIVAGKKRNLTKAAEIFGITRAAAYQQYYRVMGKELTKNITPEQKTLERRRKAKQRLKECPWEAVKLPFKTLTKEEDAAQYAGQRYTDHPDADTPKDKGWSPTVQTIRPKLEHRSLMGCATAMIGGGW